MERFSSNGTFPDEPLLVTESITALLNVTLTKGKRFKNGYFYHKDANLVIPID